jgi:S-formylglutathione hydrolase FrmB
MPHRAGWALLVILALAVGLTPGSDFRPCTWKKLNHTTKGLCGQVIDFTNNHREDNRIWSAALCQKRDVYVYLPPCFDPSKCYPAMIYLHGIAQDEVGFLRLVPVIDKAMACGHLPPMIIAAPDGTISGMPSITSAGSFYVNTPAGRFEDYVIQDVWPFVRQTFPVRPEPECHILAGASMGGFGAYNLAIKHRCQFRIAAAIFPPLHTRYLNCKGRYFANYDPDCLGLRERLGPFKAIGRFYGGLVTIRERRISVPLYGRFNPDSIEDIARENPYEMLDTHGLRPGELQMWVGYGKKDEFNLDAQCEAFVDKARGMGLDIDCVCDPEGRHSTATGIRLFPHFCTWLSQKLPALCPSNPAGCPTK